MAIELSCDHSEGMTVADKVRLLEQMWQSLCSEPDSVASPESHSDVLAKRSQRLLDGLPLAFPGAEGFYTLRATDDTPYFHHVATLAELQRAADPKKGKLYTFHFNALRSVMEKTASFPLHHRRRA